MADRYLGDGRSFAKIGAAHSYKIGDQVFFSTANHTVAGEGMLIGRLKASPEILVLMMGSVPMETLDRDCAPAGGNRAAEGASWRRAYLKERPASLV